MEVEKNNERPTLEDIPDQPDDDYNEYALEEWKPPTRVYVKGQTVVYASIRDDLVFGEERMRRDLNMTEGEVCHLISAGLLPVFMWGKTWCYLRSTVLAYLAHLETGPYDD